MAWIGIDIDQTVFDAQNVVIKGAKEAINKLHELRHRISICSARGYIALQQGITLEEEKRRIEDLFIKNGIKFTDVYFGVKPPCDFWIDDRSIVKEPQLSWEEITNRIVPLPGLVFVMLTGLPGAGKSTFLKKRFGENYVCLSRDMIVHMFSTGNTDESKVIAKRMECEAIRAAFENNKPIAIDKLNLSRKNRSLLINLAKSYKAIVAIYYINMDPKDAWEQNIQRESHKIVKKDKWDPLVKQYEPPTIDEGPDYFIEITKNNRKEYEENIPKILEIEKNRGPMEALKKDLEIITKLNKKSSMISQILKNATKDSLERRVHNILEEIY